MASPEIKNGPKSLRVFVGNSIVSINIESTSGLVGPGLKEHWAGPDELLMQVDTYDTIKPEVEEREREHWAGPDELTGR